MCTRIFWENILLVFLFLPNVQLLLFNRAIPYEAQAWSIGVEEQFYLVWPFFMNFTKNRGQFKKVIIVLLAIYIAVKLAFYLIPQLTGQHQKLDDYDNYISYIFQIDCMMIGALFGIFNFEDKTKKILTNKLVQVAAYLLVFGFIITGAEFGYFYWEIYGVLFAIIILNLVNTETSILSLDFKWIDYLGKISYSMYMFHVLMINIVIRFITHNSWYIYPLAFLFTIIVATASYELFEKRFLKWKTGFAKVQSGTSGN
jgi:peptidoglycan/LPS O-acetylase OafA/YrhL